MAFYGQSNYQHDQPDTTGVLLVNLGTPSAPDRKSVRRYLREFLADPRVVEYPRLLWWLILHGIILNVRPARSARAYQKVWTETGSPLMNISTAQMEGIRARLQARFGDNIHVALGMRYGEPSIARALSELGKHSPRRLVILPLYPQYSGSTVGSVFDAVAHALEKWRWVPELRFLSAYHDDSRYIDALADSVVNSWNLHHRGDHLLMSYHGLPKQYLLDGDPYFCQCHKTSRLLAERLQLKDSEWSVAFQSRFGRQEWLQPYCDDTLKQLAHKDVKKVDVICPGFAADCLETLEEMNIQNQQLYVEAGGENFNYIPCLNDNPDHLDFLSELAAENLDLDRVDSDPLDRQARLARAMHKGARQ